MNYCCYLINDTVLYDALGIEVNTVYMMKVTLF